jgi:hypothetical protein
LLANDGVDRRSDKEIMEDQVDGVDVEEVFQNDYAAKKKRWIKRPEKSQDIVEVAKIYGDRSTVIS